MENLRHTTDADEPTARSFLLQVAQPEPEPQQQPQLFIPINNEVAYAQILRKNPFDEQMDFRLQNPRQGNFDDNASVASDNNPRNVQQPMMSGGSSISSGYVDLTLPPANRGAVQKRNNRPTSPETSF